MKGYEHKKSKYSRSFLKELLIILIASMLLHSLIKDINLNREVYDFNYWFSLKAVTFIRVLCISARFKSEVSKWKH